MQPRRVLLPPRPSVFHVTKRGESGSSADVAKDEVDELDDEASVDTAVWEDALDGVDDDAADEGLADVRWSKPVRSREEERGA